MKLEHIGIAVASLSDSEKLFATLLGTEAYKRETVESERVETVFFQAGESKIELLGATDSSSPVAKFLEKRGEGIHHLAFEVENIETEIQRLQSTGFQFISTVTKLGADNKRIVFLHPKSTNSVLIELCETLKP